MALNIKKLQDRLQQLESGQKTIDFAKSLWKPKEGSTKIRIVPYRPNGDEQDSPFIELKFYYNLAGGTYLAPSTYGKPDPIQELVETLRSSNSQEEKSLADKLNATSRTYVPIIVRGEEDMGVRFWGFGITVYKQLLALCNPDWGDITSPTEGNDMEVKFIKEGKKKGPNGKAFPETTIVPSPRKTKVCETSNTVLLEKIKTQTDINTIFPLKSYDELKEIVEKWLNPEKSEEETNPSSEVQEAAAIAADAAVSAVPSSATESEEEFAKFFAKK